MLKCNCSTEFRHAGTVRYGFLPATAGSFASVPSHPPSPRHRIHAGFVSRGFLFDCMSVVGLGRVSLKEKLAEFLVVILCCAVLLIF